MTLVVFMFYIGGVNRCADLGWGLWACACWPYYAGKFAAEFVVVRFDK